MAATQGGRRHAPLPRSQPETKACMKNLIVATAACASMLLMGYDCAFADQHRIRIESRSIKTVSRSIGYARENIPTTTTAAAPDTGSNRYSEIISKYARQNGVEVALATAVIQIESNFNPRMRGSHGEVGLMQVKPATARMMGYSGSTKGLFDPETNIRIGMKYLALAQTLGGGPTCNTILKYNAGHGAMRMNPVSKRYCGKVLALLG
jgi:soluble lytic murein transglycosylase-like protein